MWCARFGIFVNYCWVRLRLLRVSVYDTVSQIHTLSVIFLSFSFHGLARCLSTTVCTYIGWQVMLKWSREDVDPHKPIPASTLRKALSLTSNFGYQDLSCLSLYLNLNWQGILYIPHTLTPYSTKLCLTRPTTSYTWVAPCSVSLALYWPPNAD